VKLSSCGINAPEWKPARGLRWVPPRGRYRSIIARWSVIPLFFFALCPPWEGTVLSFRSNQFKCLSLSTSHDMFQHLENGPGLRVRRQVERLKVRTILLSELRIGDLDCCTRSQESTLRLEPPLQVATTIYVRVCITCPAYAHDEAISTYRDSDNCPDLRPSPTSRRAGWKGSLGTWLKLGSKMCAYTA